MKHGEKFILIKFCIITCCPRITQCKYGYICLLMYLNLYIPSNKCYLSKAFQLEDRLEMLNVFLLHKRKLKSRIHQIKGKIIVIVNKFKACVVLAGTQKAQWSIMINYAVRMHSSPLHAPTQVNGKKKLYSFSWQISSYRLEGWSRMLKQISFHRMTRFVSSAIYKLFVNASKYEPQNLLPYSTTRIIPVHRVKIRVTDSLGQRNRQN